MIKVTRKIAHKLKSLRSQPIILWNRICTRVHLFTIEYFITWHLDHTTLTSIKFFFGWCLVLNRKIRSHLSATRKYMLVAQTYIGTECIDGVIRRRLPYLWLCKLYFKSHFCKLKELTRRPSWTTYALIQKIV